MRLKIKVSDTITAKRYLGQIRILEGRIKRDKERIETLRLTYDGVSGISYDSVRVQTSPKDSASDKVAVLVDLESKLISEVVELEQKKSEIISMIHKLDDAACEDVLYLRWITHLDFYDIAEQMKYSLRQVHRIHSKSLQMLSEKLVKNGRLK